MEDNVRDVLTDKDIEPLQTVQNSTPGSARDPGLSGPDSAIVNLLKTMHEQIMGSNQLFSGLVAPYYLALSGSVKLPGHCGAILYPMWPFV